MDKCVISRNLPIIIATPIEKEKIVFSNKLNKLVTLVRKASREDVIDELVHDIETVLHKKAAQV